MSIWSFAIITHQITVPSEEFHWNLTRKYMMKVIDGKCIQRWFSFLFRWLSWTLWPPRSFSTRTTWPPWSRMVEIKRLHLFKLNIFVKLSYVLLWSKWSNMYVFFFIGGSRWRPNGTQFFHFRICFRRKVPASEVRAPSTGNPGSATVFIVKYFSPLYQLWLFISFRLLLAKIGQIDYIILF